MGNKASTELKPLPGAPPHPNSDAAKQADSSKATSMGSSLDQDLQSARPMRGNLYRPASVQPVQPQNIYIQRDTAGSLGFSFSSARRTIHYVSSVDAGGPAEKAGLSVGHHIVAVNGNLVTNVSHEQVVVLLQNAPATKPLQLKVLPTNDRIQRYLRHAGSRSPSVLYSPTSPVNGSPRVAWGASGGSQPFHRSFCAIVFNPSTNLYLAAAKQGSGFDAIVGDVAADASFEDAAHMLLAQELNIPAQLKGILRFEISSLALRVVFLVHTTASVVTLAAGSSYVQAAWRSHAQLSALNRELGRPPWPAGALGLQTTTLLDWVSYLNHNGAVAPLHTLADPGDPVWHKGMGGESVAEQRETIRRASLSVIQRSDYKQKKEDKEDKEEEKKKKQTEAQQERARAQGAQVTAAPVPKKPATATAATTNGTTTTNNNSNNNNNNNNTTSGAAADTGRRESVLVNIPPPPPPSFDTAGTSAPTATQQQQQQQDDTHVDDNVHAEGGEGEGEEDYDPELYDRQCKELEESVTSTRMRAFYVQRGVHSTEPFGMTVTEGHNASVSLTLCQEVVVKALDPAGVVAQHGGVHVGDRLLKINGQWVADVTHAEYLLDVLADEPALDLTISRGEPLPHSPPAPLSSMTDQELQDATFEHCGLRILVHDTQGWTRAKAIGTLAERFSHVEANGAPTATTATTTAAPPATTGAPEAAATAATAATSAPANATSKDASAGADGDEKELSVSVVSDSSDMAGLKSALRRSTVSDGGDGDTSASSSKKKKGSRRSKKDSRKRSVKFHDDKPKVHETYSKFDYHRPLDPGHGFSDLRSLFNYNTDRMEQEQLREAEDFVDARRVYGNYIVRNKTTRPFGFKLRPITKDLSQPYLFLEGVEIVDIDPSGPVGQHGGIREGDRLVKINGQWVLNHQHAEYLVFEVLRRAKALDLTVTRGEPLAPSIDLSTKTDEELLDLAFEHGGYRVAIGEGQCTREDVMLLIRKRLAPSNDAAVSGLYRTKSNAGHHVDEEC